MHLAPLNLLLCRLDSVLPIIERKAECACVSQDSAYVWLGPQRLPQGMSHWAQALGFIGSLTYIP